MSKKAVKAKELTFEEKIETALKSNAEINELKIRRNCGELTPEVIEMCSKHVDNMLLCALNQKLKRQQIASMHEAVAVLKKEPEWLAKVSQFTDAYEEVLLWNKMIKENIIRADSTMSHREQDIALLQSILDKYHGTYINPLSYIICCYAYHMRDCQPIRPLA